jgi:hypothetical protein
VDGLYPFYIDSAGCVSDVSCVGTRFKQGSNVDVVKILYGNFGWLYWGVLVEVVLGEVVGGCEQDAACCYGFELANDNTLWLLGVLGI